MLHVIDDYTVFKKQFSLKFYETLNAYPAFREFCYEIFTVGTAYVVGGFVRDITLNKNPRDLDMLVHLSHEKIIDILKNSRINYKINRLKGVKLLFENFQVDLWSIDHNWAFESNVVERNEDNILESIANGCFFNFDSLVINLHSNNLNVRHYNDMVQKKTLDIIQRNKYYKKLNPTIEANILRAFYLKEKYDLSYSKNCHSYIQSRLGFLEDQYHSCFVRLTEYVKKYPKYQELLNNERIEFYIKNMFSNKKQIILNFKKG